MAEWRETGYVPDSDDEEDESQFTKAGPAPALPSSASDLPQLVTQSRSGDANSAELHLQDEVTGARADSQNSHDIDASSTNPSNKQSASLQDVHPKDNEPENANLPSRSSADFLQSQRDFGLPPVTEILETHFAPINFSSSIASSPLSSLLSSQSDPTSATSPIEQIAQTETFKQATNIYIQDDPSESAGIILPNGRTLRQRAPIQQNPYTLEAVKYQQSLKARGIKPVRVFESKQNETQNQDSAGSQQELPSSQYKPPKSPRRTQQRPGSSRRSSTDLRRDLDENPFNGPFDTIFGGADDTLGFTQLAYKRRKLLHARSIRDPAIQRDYDSIFDFPADDLDESPGDRAVWQQEDGMVLDTTTSPEKTEAEPGRDVMVSEDGFRFPRGITPPRTFSLRRSADRMSKTPTASENDEPSGGVGGDRDEVSESDSEADSEKAEDDSQRVVQFQRRIKGVLPASWLRLDRMKETRPTVHRLDLNSDSPEKVLEGRGVAHKIRRLRDERNQSGQWYDTLLSDDSSSSGSSTPAPTTSIGEPHQTRLDAQDLFEDDGDDVVEDDPIDAMVPKSPRSRALIQSTTKHQRIRLDSSAGLAKKSKHPTRKRLVKAHHRQSKISDHIEYRETRVLMHPRLPSSIGILDAADLTTRSYDQQPQFLKIAARQARSRKDLGRRKPDQKFIRLATRSETQEANQVLSEWKDGRIPRTSPQKLRRAAALVQRPPLQERAVNTQPGSVAYSVIGSQPATTSHPTEQLIMRILDKQRALGHVTSPKRPVKPSAETINTQSAEKTKRVTRPAQRRFYGNGSLISRLRKGSAMRDAQIEAENNGAARHAPTNHFTAALAALNRQSRGRDRGERTEPIEAELSESTTSVVEDIPTTSGLHPTKMKTLPRRPRKSVPKRRTLSKLAEGGRRQVLQGGRQESIRQFIEDVPDYPTDFGLDPSPIDVCLGYKTLAGSGRLAKYLGLQPRKTDGRPVDNPRVDLVNSHEICQAGDSLSRVFSGKLWQTEMFLAQGRNGSELDSLFATGELVDSRLAIDRLDGLLELLSDQKTSSSAINICQNIPPAALQAAIEAGHHISDISDRICLYTRLALLAYQGYGICLQHHISTHLKSVTTVYEKLLSLLGSLVLRQDSLTSLRSLFLDALHKGALLIHGPGNTRLDALVTLQHVLDTAPLPSRWSRFWDFYNDCTSSSKDVSDEVRSLEMEWQGLFVTTVAMRFTPYGTIDIDKTSAIRVANWAHVKELLLQGCPSLTTGSQQAQDLPFYMRAVYQRCLSLTQKFHWFERETILDVLYDLFRHRNFGCPPEEHYDYPEFLDHLTETTMIQIQQKDSSFCCLLKLIAVTIKDMSGQSKDDPQIKRRLKNLLFRLVPNNGHVSSKYEAIEEHSLTPLKNHHDLLTTLYWVSPVQYRPRLQRFQDLVDFSESHLGACRVSLKTWTRIAKFQSSIDESLSSISALVGMLSVMVQAMVKQHRAAAHEVQAHRASWSDDHVDSVIKYNKAQIESFLSEVVEALDRLVKDCRDDAQAITFVPQDIVSWISGLFSSRSTHSDDLFVNTFKLVLTMVRRNFGIQGNSKTPHAIDDEALGPCNEDSQEFGDWSHLEALIDTAPQIVTLEYVNSSLFAPLFRLFCDVMGADTVPAPTRIEELLWSWSTIIQALAAHGLHQAGNFVSAHHHESWFWLKNTPQKHCYYPLFAKQLIEKLGSRFYEENRVQILESYVRALAEPSSFHTWLPQLTKAITAYDEPILHTSSSLPLIEAKPPRILSVMLLNIRAARGSDRINTFSRDLVMALLTAMKANYKELDGQKDRKLRDEYVKFIHDVLGEISIFLPTYRKLEPFFNDVALFPQPASSIYISLRQYSLSLTDVPSQKSLITFIYNILERAALEDEQHAVGLQLGATLDDLQRCAVEMGDDSTQLQQFLLQNIFPAYIESMCSEKGRCMVTPVLYTIQHVFESALPVTTTVHIGEPALSMAVMQDRRDKMSCAGDVVYFLRSITSLLAAFQHVLQAQALDSVSLERNPHAVEDLFLVITTMSKMLKPINGLQRMAEQESSQPASELFCWIFQALVWFNSYFANLQDQIISGRSLMLFPHASSEEWPAVRASSNSMYAFTRSELSQALKSSWTGVEGREVYVNKHSGPKEVTSAKRRDAALRREIEQTGVEWAKWTVWTACKMWSDEWQRMDGIDEGHNNNEGTLRARVSDESWRAFVL